jgi:hypothetical protein
VAGDLAGQHHVAAGDRHAAYQGLAGVVTPPRRGGRSVERGQPAPRADPEIELERTAEEQVARFRRLGVGRVLCRSDLSAPIRRRD